MNDARPALLLGRCALVIGAGGGIGKAVLQEFHLAGARAVGADLNASAELLACDVTDEDSIRTVFDEAGQDGALTDVVNCAGVASLGPVHDLDLDEWRRVLDINLTGSFLITREAARRLGPGGTVTLLGSQAGRRGAARWSAYCASKFGLVGLGESAAQELAARGVRLNVVCPGTVDTPMLDALVADLAGAQESSPAEVRVGYEQGIPLGRLGRPEEIGRVCVFLASGLASYVAGASLVVDGGELS